MPITTSAKKALRSSRRKREFNMARKEAMTTAVKKFRKLVTAGKIDEAKKMISTVDQTIDKAAKTNLIKKNNASRIKSRLAAMLKKASGK